MYLVKISSKCAKLLPDLEANLEEVVFFGLPKNRHPKIDLRVHYGNPKFNFRVTLWHPKIEISGANLGNGCPKIEIRVPVEWAPFFGRAKFNFSKN